jgi:MSHA biogenesis protein MshJ
MKAIWLKMISRYDALQRRERWLVAVAVLGGVVLLGFTLFIEPALKRSQLAERTMVEQRAQLASMQAQMTALQSPDRNPDVAARAELESIRAQLEDLSGRLRTLENSLVPPEKMPGLLEDMIGKRSGLRLLRLKNLPVTPFAQKEASDAGEATARMEKAGEKIGGLYKHGVEVSLEGSYQELTAYLERLEKSHLKLLWSSVALSAEKHPRLVLTLTVYSLSLDRAWLVV